MTSQSALTVFCVVCHTEVAVRSRMEFGDVDSTHRIRCRTRVVLYNASIEDLLDLPLY